tara:strand:- start:4329 stop:6074 length:1746 start_codon:yes stop_codon:yes gene_type:complete
MTRRIHILPDTVANQIAAGEAVERPASVVKELVENALDALATQVDVVIERGGKQRIRVSDNGTGMSREDALLCFDRHATSKISVVSDLEGVGTLGFRGEALSSIVAVSRTTVETFDADEASGVGTRVATDAGRITAIDDFPRQRGTTVEVRNLFFNAPARAKFLKAVGPETRVISEALTGLALANPNVAFSFSSNGKVLLELAATGEVSTRIGQLWGNEKASSLLVVTNSEAGLELRGLVQRPDQVKSGIRRGYLFVNGRPFRATSLLRAGDRGYRTTIPVGGRPWMFLYLTVPGEGVDVNVHPAKAEVRFRDQNRVESLIEEAVKSALSTEESSATFDTQLTPPPKTEGSVSALKSADDSVPQAQMAFLIPGVEEVEAEEAEGFHELASVRQRLWQALDTYIIAETRDGLLIIDQHSAHERILFQRLMDAFETGGEEGQRLLFPLTIRLTELELACIEELSSLFLRTGFEVEGFGGETVIIRTAPNPHPYFDAERAFREMVHELTHGSELVRSARNQHERIAMTFACKTAIKAGQKLSELEMQELFDQLFATELPHHDVHGRPTVVRLSTEELGRKFGRS